MYSALLLDHFQNPRNAGEIPDADATAEIENPACGDVMRFSVKFDRDRIADIRFKAKGCVPAIGCASALTQLVRGKTVEQARQVGSGDLVSAVGGLPPASSHAAQLALDVLSAVVGQASKKS